MRTAYRQREDEPAPARPHLRPLEDAPNLDDLRFRRLLSAQDWARLPEAVRRRFTKRLKRGDSAVYRGTVAETRMNWAGALLAKLLSPIGAPLPLERCARSTGAVGGTSVVGGNAAVVTVTEDAGSHGQFWTRHYNRRRGFPQVIHSTKTFTGPTGLEEHVGAGIGMSLSLKADGQSLLFISDRYFIAVFGRRFYLPRALCPGRLVVGHHDLGEGRFEFTLDLVHPWFGELMHQSAIFAEMTEAPHDHDASLESALYTDLARRIRHAFSS